MSFLRNRWLTLAARLVLGGFFIIAAWHKIGDPPDFAKAIYNYKLLPGSFIHLSALFLAWLELFAGLALVSRAFTVPLDIAEFWLKRNDLAPPTFFKVVLPPFDCLVRGGAATTGLLSLLFIAALSFNLYRSHPTICGCFSTFAEGKSLTDVEKFAKMWREVFLDCGLFLLAAQILFASARERVTQTLLARTTA